MITSYKLYRDIKQQYKIFIQNGIIVQLVVCFNKIV